MHTRLQIRQNLRVPWTWLLLRTFKHVVVFQYPIVPNIKHDTLTHGCMEIPFFRMGTAGSIMVGGAAAMMGNGQRICRVVVPIQMWDV